ncbi:MAG: DUF5995 family protein [Alphaproteobacteria bacterium]|nr:DUF5995 family protein [Alphaproteobacteria bacterium]
MHQCGDAKETLRIRALSVLEKIDGDRQRFEAMADEPGQRIHSLFAGLYWSTTRAWLSFLADHSQPEFAYLVIMRFYDLYREASDVVDQTGTLPHHWQPYFGLAERQTYTHPISAHLILISLAARAHTRHDLALAVRRAYDDFQHQFGTCPDLTCYRNTVVSPDTDAAFRRAALEYIALHRRRQRGWRRLVLRLYAIGIRALRFVWLPVFQSWRAAAWDDACAWIEASSKRV